MKVCIVLIERPSVFVRYNGMRKNTINLEKYYEEMKLKKKVDYKYLPYKKRIIVQMKERGQL